MPQSSDEDLLLEDAGLLKPEASAAPEGAGLSTDDEDLLLQDAGLSAPPEATAAAAEPIASHASASILSKLNPKVLASLVPAHIAGKIDPALELGPEEAPKPEISMREATPREAQLEPTPSSAHAGFVAALNSLTSGDAGSAFGLETGLPGAHAAISDAAARMAVPLAPGAAEVVSNMPPLFDPQDTLVDGQVVSQAPKTLGEQLERIAAGTVKENPQARDLKERIDSYLRVDPGEFSDEFGASALAGDLQAMAGAPLRAVAEMIPTTPGGAGLLAIDVYGLVEAGAAMRGLAAAAKHGMPASDQAAMAEKVAAAARSLRDKPFAIETMTPIEEARFAAQRALGDAKAFFARHGRIPTAADAEDLAPLRQPALPFEQVDRIAADFERSQAAAPISPAKATKALPSRGVLAPGADIRLSGTLFPGQSMQAQFEAREAARLAGATKSQAGVLSKVKFDPESYLRIYGGENGAEIVRRIKLKNVDNAALDGLFFEKLRPVEALNLTPAEQKALRVIGDPVKRAEFIGQTLPPDEAAKAALQKIISAPNIRDEVKVRIVKAHKIITDALETVVNKARGPKAFTSDAEGFLSPDKEFNDTLFNKNNFFSYYYDTVNDKTKANIITAVKKQLRGDTEYMAKLFGKTADEATSQISKDSVDVAEAAIKGYRDGAIAKPENGWKLAELGMKGESQDLLRVIKEVGSSWSDRAIRIEHLGPRGKYVRDLADKIIVDPRTAKGFDYGLLKDTTKLVSDGHLGAASQGSLSSAALSYNTFTKLMSAPLSNLTQFANAVGKFGFKDTAAAMSDLWQAEGKDGLINFYKSVIEATEKQALAESLGTDVSGLARKSLFNRSLSPQQALDAIYFPATERKQRLLAMKGSDYYIDRQARILASEASGAEKRVALEKLKEAGLSDRAILAARKGKVAQADKTRAAITLADQIMSKATATNVPLAFQDPVFKVLLQFKKQMYRQTAFVTEQLLSPAGGNTAEKAAFLTKLFATGTAAGIPLSVMKDFFSGKPLDEYAAVKLHKAVTEGDFSGSLKDAGVSLKHGEFADAARDLTPWGDVMRALLSNTGSSFALGAFGDIAQGMTSDKKGSVPGKGLLGPSGGEALDFGYASSRAAAGDFKPIERFAITRGLPVAAVLSGSPKAYLATAALGRILANELTKKEGDTSQTLPGAAIEKGQEILQRRRLEAASRKIRIPEGQRKIR